MTKTIFLLNIGDYAPEITRLTYPLIRHYARRIGAKIQTIKERKFHDWPLTYEKLQIHRLAPMLGSDWNLYIDSDTLIHPECPDFTIYLPKGTISFHSSDIAHIRFENDEYSLRDGRYIGPGNWFMIASDLCLDLWRPLEGEPDEAVSRIHPTPEELAHGITPEHLVDDYALAKNIARFGLSFKSFLDIYKECNQSPIQGTAPDGRAGYSKEFLFHVYTATKEEKIAQITKQIADWKVGHCLERWS